MTTSRTDIFLSYSREDQATARRFADALAREGLAVWWDQRLRSGETYDTVTEGALRAARAVVVLWSKTSVDSRWVRAEATTADRRGTLVPVMIEPCERPIMFELIHTAELGKWSGEPDDPAWRAFLADVRGYVDKGAPAPVAGSASTATAAVPATNAAPLRGAPRDERPSLAILPFTNRSGQSADDAFADGMVEDLIEALSLGGQLKVIAYGATIAYRGKVGDLRTVGRELDVRYLMEGNVRRVAESLRVTAQLVQADNAGILWAQRFDRPLSELAALQEQLVAEVASHLGVQLERFEMERALRKPDDLTAWEAVMRSRAAVAGDFSIQTSGRALAEARRAVAIAPDYALGHAQLATALSNLHVRTGGSDAAIPMEAREHAERALSLDPNDSFVLASAAIALGQTSGWQVPLSYARRSLEINPSNHLGHTACAMGCIHENRPDEAILHLRRTESLAPRGPLTFVAIAMQGIAYFQSGRYEEALQALDRGLLHNPGFLYSLKDRPVYLAKLGRDAEARAAVQRLRAAFPTLTLQTVERTNAISFIPSATAADMNATLRSVWQTT